MLQQSVLLDGGSFGGFESARAKKGSPCVRHISCLCFASSRVLFGTVVFFLIPIYHSNHPRYAFQFFLELLLCFFSTFSCLFLNSTSSTNCTSTRGASPEQRFQ
ncbi:hypothetical protein HOY82DRAFT_209248 [Tuber indicum]|nr:hypothetical protein HOY82DRAFT_209248 [Tuber indicum]